MLVIKMAILSSFIKNNLELLCWLLALIALLFLDPLTAHFSLCPFKNLGIGFCPGCGIGHSIHYALFLDLKSSLHAHPLGIAATGIIINRIYHLIKLNKNHEQTINTTHSGNRG